MYGGFILGTGTHGLVTQRSLITTSFLQLLGRSKKISLIINDATIEKLQVEQYINNQSKSQKRCYEK